MHVSMLVVAAAALLSMSAAAEPARSVLLAQADAPSAEKPAEKPPPKKKKARKKKATKKTDEKKAAETKPAEPAPAPPAARPAEPAPAPAPGAAPQAEAPPDVPSSVPPTGAAAPALETAKPEPVPTSTGEGAPAPSPDAASAAAPAAADASGEDNDPPSLSHTPITHAPRGKSLRVEAHAADPAGVHQVILYLRRHGGPDYIPLKFVADKNTVGSYSVEVPTALLSSNLEYYIETYDNLGNGPTRAGSPERPLPIRLDEPIQVKAPEEEKKVIIQQQQRPPPAITHSAVNKVVKGKSIEIVAKIKGPSGVSKPAVKFRQLGDSDWKSLPMGNIGEQYTATIPGSQTSRDIEYYVEAFDSAGVSPGNSASADAPFLIRVAEEEAPPKLVTGPVGPVKPRFVPAPFKPNPGRAAGYFALAAALGTLTFAGGEAYAAWQANENYTHTFKVEGRNDPALLKRATDYSSRAKTFAIIGAAAAVAATVLLIVFTEHPTEIPAGSGGDVTLFRF